MSKIDNRFSWFKKIPLYVLGKMDPIGFSSNTNRKKAEPGFEFKRQYSTYAGVDINTYIDGKNEGTILSIGFVEDSVSPVSGTVCDLSISNFDRPRWADNRAHHYAVKATNEYGQSAKRDYGYFVVDSMSWDTSIDSLTTERHYTLRLAKPWEIFLWGIRKGLSNGS